MRKRDRREKRSNIASLLATQCVTEKSLRRGKVIKPSRSEPTACSHQEKSLQRGGTRKCTTRRANNAAVAGRVPTAITSSQVPLDINQTAHSSAGARTVEIEKLHHNAVPERTEPPHGVHRKCCQDPCHTAVPEKSTMTK